MKYKFLREGLKSDKGDLSWKIGKWMHHDGELNMCNAGLHCSMYPDQAFSYVQGEILALVQTKGKSIVRDDKECWSDMPNRLAAARSARSAIVAKITSWMDKHLKEMEEL